MPRHLIAVLSVGLTVATSAVVAMATPAAAATACSSAAPHDTNGDGYSDVAIGSPTSTHAATRHAGAVTAFTGGVHGLTKSTTFVQGAGGVPSKVGKHFFGQTLLLADVNGDGCADLIVGSVQGSSFPKAATTVLFGSPGSGLRTTGAQFAGTTSPLTAGDYNGDGFADLVAQVYEQRSDGIPDCCLYDVVPGSASGLRFDAATPIPTPSQMFAYGAGVTGDANGDGFDDVALTDAGNDTIQVVYGSADGLGGGAASQQWDRSSPGVPGDDVDFPRFPDVFGDFNGDGYGDLSFGEWNGGEQTDHVTVLYGGPGGLSATGAQDWAKTTPGVPGHRHEGDAVGVAVGAGDFNGNGADELVAAASPDLLAIPGSTGGLVAKGSRLWRGTTGTAFTAGAYGNGTPDDLLIATGAAACVVDYGTASTTTGLAPKAATELALGTNENCETLPKG
jgi:hypothetical protein